MKYIVVLFFGLFFGLFFAVHSHANRVLEKPDSKNYEDLYERAPDCTPSDCRLVTDLGKTKQRQFALCSKRIECFED